MNKNEEYLAKLDRSIEAAKRGDVVIKTIEELEAMERAEDDLLPPGISLDKGNHRKSIEELFDGYAGEHEEEDIDSGEPVGHERFWEEDRLENSEVEEAAEKLNEGAEINEPGV